MQETRALVNDNLLNKLTFYILYFKACNYASISGYLERANILLKINAWISFIKNLNYKIG